MTPANKDRKHTSVYAEIGPYASLGIQFALTILFFAGGGWWLDGYLEVSPLFLLVSTLLGAVAGSYKLHRTLMDIEKKRKREVE